MLSFLLNERKLKLNHLIAWLFIWMWTWRVQTCLGAKPPVACGSQGNHWHILFHKNPSTLPEWLAAHPASQDTHLNIPSYRNSTFKNIILINATCLKAYSLDSTERSRSNLANMVVSATQNFKYYIQGKDKRKFSLEADDAIFYRYSQCL